MKKKILLFCMLSSILGWSTLHAQQWVGLNGYFGTNLSGAEFSPEDTPPYGIDGYNYSFPSVSDIDYFAGKGMKLIRLPIRWERVQPDLNSQLNAAYFNQIKNLVDHARLKDVQVILDLHNFARRGVNGTGYTIDETSNLTKEHLADVWKKLAVEFKDYNNILGYDIMNEPHDMGTSDRWFNIAQCTINAIREIDTTNTIIISGDAYSSSMYWEKYSGNLVNLIDPAGKELLYQAHVYFDLYAGGHRVGEGYTYETEQAYPMIGVDRVRPFVKWLQRNNKKGILGEYAVPDNDERWNVVLENLMVYLQRNGIPGTYWSAGPRWGDYQYSLQPNSGNPSDWYATDYTKDRPQMGVLSRYTTTNPQVITLTEPLPLQAATVPPLNQNNIVSLYSDTYQNVPVADLFWGGDFTQKEQISIGGNNTLKISNLDYYGIDGFYANATEMSYLNFDIWTDEATCMKIILQDNSWRKAATNTPHNIEFGKWNTISIPLRDFLLDPVNPQVTVDPLSKIYNALQIVANNGSTIYLDNIYFSKEKPSSSIIDPDPDPELSHSLIAAPVPNKSSENVISLFSNSYENLSVNLAPAWGQKSSVETISLNGNSTWKISGFDWFPIEFSANATGMDYLHLDIWTDEIQTIEIKLVNRGNTWLEKIVETPTLSNHGWNSIDIPLFDYISQGTDISDLRQIKFVAKNTGTAYMDNIFFFKGNGEVVEPGNEMGAAPIPALPSANVISLFSDTYPNRVSNIAPNWGQSSLTEIVSIGGNATLKITDFDWFPLTFQLNVSNSEFLHLDVWCEETDRLHINLVSEGNPWMEKRLTTSFLSAGSWNSINIPLSEYTNMGIDCSKLREIKISSENNNEAKVYIDNIYFYSNTSQLRKTTDIDGSARLNSIQIFPNPATDNLFIETDADIKTVTVYNLFGSKIKIFNIDKNQAGIDISALPSGNYFMIFIMSDGESIAKQLIKK